MSTTATTKHSPSTFLKGVFDKAKSVRTPIQLISFFLAIILSIVLFRATPGTNVLAFMILLLPFILLILFVKEATLQRLSTGGYALTLVASLVIIGSFVMSGYVAITLVRSSAEGLVQSSPATFLDPSRKARIQEIKDGNFRIESYYESYRLVARYYHDALMKCFLPRDSDDSDYSIVAALGKELNSLINKIFATEKATLNEIYGRNEDINQLVIKLQESTLALDSTSYFSDVVLTIYGAKGQTYQLDQLIDVKDWKVSKAEQLEIEHVQFSQVEADLIRALGREIVIKPIDGLTQQDIKSIRNALQSLGYLADSSSSFSDVDVFNKYRSSLNDYFTPQQQAQLFYALAFQGIQTQIPLYLVLYDSSLLDLKRFLLKYCPPKASEILLRLMAEKISLFNLDDVDKLTQAILEQRAGAGSALAHSNTIIFKIRDNMRKIVGNSAQAQEVLQSSTVEEYFIRSLRVALRKGGWTRRT